MFMMKMGLRGSAVFSAMLFGVLMMAVPTGESFATENSETIAKVKKEMRESRKEIRKAMKQTRGKVKQAVRGGLVYKSYCVVCHGETGDGDGNTKAGDGLLMKINKQTPAFFEEIILEGGVAVQRSKFMPSWKDVLSTEQIGDLVTYLSMVTDPVSRGEVVFKTNCILCHGLNGDGMGRAAVLFDPPPTDLTRSDKNDIYKKMIITMGGEAMGRSSVMPIWGMELSDDEIDDAVAYLRTILVVPYPE